MFESTGSSWLASDAVTGCGIVGTDGALVGVGTDTAATLLVAGDDDPRRLHSEAAWPICAVSPRPGLVV